MTKENNTRLLAFLGVLLTVIGFIIVYALKKNDKYAMYYAKHGIVIFLIGIVISIASIIPIIGWIVSTIAWILLLIVWIIGMIYSLSGKEKIIPVISTYAKMIRI